MKNFSFFMGLRPVCPALMENTRQNGSPVLALRHDHLCVKHLIN